VIINQKEDLKETYCNFYKNLYKAQKEVPSQPQLRHRVLDSMPKIFASIMNFKLTQTIPIEDLHIVAQSIAREKAPKLDGVAFEFYIFFWK
jgi:hypothetical protein